MFGRKNAMMVTADMALPGRTDQTMPVPAEHFELGTPLVGPWPEGYETLVVGMGCFWGAERKFWQADGVHSTNVGYAGGFTPNPSYEEVCTGSPATPKWCWSCSTRRSSRLENMLSVFWENHDPTQGMRQGNDIGTQYRSAVFTADDRQATIARDVAVRYGRALAERGYGEVTTEIAPAKTFFLAEEYHQQYLEANPRGYCGIGGTGVSCPVGLDLD